MGRQPRGVGGWTEDLASLVKHGPVHEELRAIQARGGWIGRRTGGGHVLLRHENGGTAANGSTPSCHRGLNNFRAQVARAEATPPHTR